MSNKTDAWLYGTPRQRKAIAKRVKGDFRAGGEVAEASSDSAFRFLEKSPAELADRARITNWGAHTKGEAVSVYKSGDDGPPPSRQLRDPFTTFYVQGIALEPPLPPDRLLNLTEESALHSACLQALATDSCGRGWSFEPKEGKEGDEDLIQSEIPEKLRAAMEDITPELTFTELLYQAAWEMRAIGWGVWEVGRRGNNGKPGEHGKIGAIYPIPSHTIRASLDPRKWVQIRAGRVRYFKKFGAECTINNETGEVFEWKNAGEDRKAADGMPEEYMASEIIIFKTYTPRSLWYGLPPWVSAIATIAELGAIREFNISWFASGGQVDYHVHFKAGSIEKAIKMKEQVDDQIRENAGRGHTKLFTAGDQDTEVKSEKLGETLREGHFRFRRGDLIKEVLIAHQVPPYRIGWAETGALGGNAADEMLGAYSVGAVAPIQRVIEDRLRTTLFDPKIGIKTDEFRLKLKPLELEDIKTELSLVESATEGGYMTGNQARERLGMDPDENKAELNEYYYKGQPLGAPPPAQPGFGGEPDQGDTGEQGDQGDYQEEAKAKSAGAEARRIVRDMLSDYETKLKASLADSDPIDSEQPPSARPARGRGRQRPVTPAGPARGDKPSFA